ncbi:MAG: PEGA domain-containing protein [Nitrospinota bacterium]
MRTPANGRGKAALGAALALLLALGGLSGCAWWEKNVGQRVEKMVTKRLLITTDPPDADVYVNNVFQGKTPLTLTFRVNVRDFMKGFAIVVQKEGYVTLQREVDYKTDSVQFKLNRQPPR